MNKIKISRSKLPIYALLMPILLLSSNTQGAEYAKKEELYIEYKQPAQVTISSTGINRISLVPFIATTIWGDSAQYSLLLSHNGSELFLTFRLIAIGTYTINTCTSLIFYIFLPPLPLLILPSPLT